MAKRFSGRLFRNILEEALGPNYQAILANDSVVSRNSLAKWVTDIYFKKGPSEQNLRKIKKYLSDTEGITVDWKTCIVDVPEEELHEEPQSLQKLKDELSDLKHKYKIAQETNVKLNEQTVELTRQVEILKMQLSQKKD